MSAATPLVDSVGRCIDYLRISLTERCDLHCAYCHPGRRTAPSTRDVLTADDIVNIARAALGVGICRFRLTGGEPLLREDLEAIVARLTALPDLADLSLTTNGQQLAGRAQSLADAGLMRVNISLDSLDAEAYSAITGGGDVGAVRRGLEAALVAGLSPVKINVVLFSAAVLERDDIADFAELVQSRPVHVRFIEAMPTCDHVGYLPASVVLDRLRRLHNLLPVPGPNGAGPAQYYRLGDSSGTVGVITPISSPFCSRCNRLRITARGEIKPCLFSAASIHLLPALREADPVPHIAALITEAVAAKPPRYGDVAEASVIHAMHVIGG